MLKLELMDVCPPESLDAFLCTGEGDTDKTYQTFRQMQVQRWAKLNDVP